MFSEPSAPMRFIILRPFGSTCSYSTVYEGQLSKHCWKTPHTDGWRDQGYGGLRLHHRSDIYYSHCLYVDCDVDIRDGLTRGTIGEEVYADGDELRLLGCCGTRFVVVAVTIERVGNLCHKKVYLMRTSPSWSEDMLGKDECLYDTDCESFDIPETVFVTLGDGSGSSMMVYNGIQWTGSHTLACGVAATTNMSCSVGPEWNFNLTLPGCNGNDAFSPTGAQPFTHSGTVTLAGCSTSACDQTLAYTLTE